MAELQERAGKANGEFLREVERISQRQEELSEKEALLSRVAALPVNDRELLRRLFVSGKSAQVIADLQVFYGMTATVERLRERRRGSAGSSRGGLQHSGEKQPQKKKLQYQKHRHDSDSRGVSESRSANSQEEKLTFHTFTTGGSRI